MSSPLRPWAFAITMAVTVACNGGTGGTGGGSLSGGVSTLDVGFCADTCPKPCGTDNDCMTESGELCCDFGADGKACTDAKACPRQCNDDNACDSLEGEACVRLTLESSLEVCADPSAALSLCKADDDCKNAGDVCCTAYDEPVCLAASLCPKTCSTSSQCQTGVGEVCCTTLPQVDATLEPGGICVTPSEVPCPVACTQSSDCNTKQGELCCDGLCSQHCARKCSASSDCTNQLCCQTRAALSPLARGGKAPGYHHATPSVPVAGSGGTTCDGFTCDDATCIDASWRCDGSEDCAHGEDELSCAGGSGTGAGSGDCAGTGAGSICNTCCEEQQPTGAAQFADAVAACLCGSGPCAAPCADSSFCVDPSVDELTALSVTCQTCLNGSCNDTVANACFSATACLDYLTCTQGC